MDPCTCVASRCSAQNGIFWFVTTSVNVVLPVGPLPDRSTVPLIGANACSLSAIDGHFTSGMFRWQRTTRPLRSTIVPGALTPVNTPIFVGPIVRNAPPCPECDHSAYLSALLPLM